MAALMPQLQKPVPAKPETTKVLEARRLANMHSSSAVDVMQTDASPMRQPYQEVRYRPAIKRNDTYELNNLENISIVKKQQQAGPPPEHFEKELYDLQVSPEIVRKKAPNVKAKPGAFAP